MSKLYTTSWEFMDGSIGEQTFESEGDANEEAYRVSIANPTARVWVNDQIVQHGFIAADERAPL
jgi:hypothetical protein